MKLSEVITGGEPGDHALVRHLELTGSQRDIGHDIAELAWSKTITCVPSPVRIQH